ncbi:MAG: NAD(P)/FAD-dependent oxidoreductase [Methanomicrobium sp.]|nr:NAD(P)/FAD-dependent oxidoreductase [Methanomicrobium sp.]
MITVIGGGPAGRFAAIYLARAGEKVRLIEKRGALGGQCLHEGCMVICGLNDVAKLLDESEKLKKLAVLNSVPEVSLPDIWTEMSKIQSVISGILDKETKDAGVEVILGEAFIYGSEVSVDGKILESDSVLIATGSKPYIPDIPGNSLSGVYTPHTIFKLKELPKKLLIIGGGVIAAEYSYIFSAFGTDVTIVSRSGFLRDKPKSLKRATLSDIKRVNVLEYTLLREICGEEKVSSAILENGGSRYESKCDAILFASGLTPRTENISGIAKGGNGEILINENYETSIKGVYAAGDATGMVFMTPYARMQGLCAAKSILGEDVPEIPKCIPQSIKLFYEHSFCFAPQKDSEDIGETGLPAPSGPGSFWSVPERNTGRSMIRVEKKSGRVLGMYLGAPSSSVVASYMAYLIENGLKTSDFEKFIEVHPSADGIYSLIKYVNSLVENN